MNSKKIQYSPEHYISVIGVDNLKHIALPWEKECLCGVKIKTKKMDNNNNNCLMYRFSCYQCTY